MLHNRQDLFRKEALDDYGSGSSRHGAPLRLLPRWIRWCYPALMGVVGTGAFLLFSAHVAQYASGPSIIKAMGYSDVISPVAGVVESIPAAPGECVRSGQPLVLLNSAEQEAECERVQKEFEDQLANHLRDLLDPSAVQQVAALRTQLEFATRMRDLRCLEAPSNGEVADIRTQVGQEILPGQVAMTLRSGSAGFQVLAAIPGRFRPMLKTGAPAWLRLEGYPHDALRTTVRRVDASVIGPKEAARYLGAGAAGAMELSGPIVLVRASLPESTFAALGRRYSHYDGMQGRLEVRVQTEPMILALIPGLRSVIERGRR